MSMQQLLQELRDYDGVLELAPTEGSQSPPIAWGDHFFFYAPDGQIPPGQPYATIVTKNYPGDTASELDRVDRWRVNIHVGKTEFRDLTGRDPRDESPLPDAAASDTVLPHPLYGPQGWIAIVNPGARTDALARRLLRAAHDAAAYRAAKRSSR